MQQGPGVYAARGCGVAHPRSPHFESNRPGRPENLVRPYMGSDPQRRELIGYTLRYQHLDLSPGNIEFAGEPSYAPRRLKP